MSRFTTFVLMTLLVFAPAALAVDGTVLINQSTITNGLPGCPTGGHFPIVICQSGSYRLSGNVTVPDANTDAIHINADNVTLDLNGFAILGPATCKSGTFPVQCSTTGNGVGIFSLHNNIGVSNGTISGMGSAGIRFLDETVAGTVARFDGLRVTNNAGVAPLSSPDSQFDKGQAGGGIIASFAIISNCMVSTNAQHGILAKGTANLNNVTFNGGFGILGDDSQLIASNNNVQQNGQDCISDVGLAVNNIVQFNIGFGLSCHSPGSCGFEGNVFLFNNGGTVNNGTSMGHNFCNGTAC